MKKLALIAAIVSTAAIAQADEPHWNNTDRHGDYDRRTDEGGRYDARDRGQAVPLANMNIARKETVDIGRQAGQFHALRLQALRGVAYVDFVTVRYHDGQQAHFDIKRRIGRGEVADFAIADQGGTRAIDAITVHGRPDRWSQIQVIGLR